MSNVEKYFYLLEATQRLPAKAGIQGINEYRM